MTVSTSTQTPLGNSALKQGHSADRELVVERIFDAPRELVFNAWIDSKRIGNWWGPQGFTTTTHEMDARPGGVWRFIMRGPDGTDYDNRVIYDEIVRPERIAYFHDGDIPDDPAQFYVTITFAEQGNKTKLTMRSVFASAAELERVKGFGAVEGAQQTLSRLAAELAKSGAESSADTSDREFVVERVFDAPRWLVFRAWSDSKHLTQWFGPKGWTLPVSRMDFRPGGSWHYCMKGPQGEESWGITFYHEIVEPERIVYTDYFSNPEGTPAEGMPELKIAIDFIDVHGKTKVVSRTILPSAADLKTMLEMGMGEGVRETWDRLDEYLRDTVAASLNRSEDLVIERIFDAPRELVFRAWTEPKRLAQWWGPHGFTNPVCEVDARPGGSMLIHMRAPDGSVFPMKAIFEEVVPPERLVFSDSALEDAQGVPQLETRTHVTFTEHDGKTKMTLRTSIVRAAPEAASALVGMEEGWNQSLDKLAAFLG